MRTYKKAGLSLSVNAIVVLVLAITMLGLGIAFTRNMFTSLEDRLMEGVDYENVPMPSVANPIAMESTNVNVAAGGNTAFGMKILNTLNEQANLTIEHGSGSTCNQTNALLSFVPKHVDFIGTGEVAEVAGIIRTTGTPLTDRNQIMGCPILVTLEGSDSNRTFSTTVRISSR